MKLIRCHAVFLAATVAFAQVETREGCGETRRTSVKLTADLTPFQSVDLFARVNGYVDRILVDRGSKVRKGQLIAVITAPELKAQLAEAQSRVEIINSQRAEAEAKLASTQATYDRMKTASATPGAIAGNELVIAEKSLRPQIGAGRARKLERLGNSVRRDGPRESEFS